MSYQSLSQLGSLIEEINDAIDEQRDDAEIAELIAQYQAKQANEVESIYAAITFCDKETELIDEKIESLNFQKKRIAQRKEYLRKFFIDYIDRFGEVKPKQKNKSLQGEYFTFTRIVGKKVKEDLTDIEVPDEYIKFKIKNWLTTEEFETLCGKLNKEIKYDEEIDKQGLAKYAKENGKEDEYLEDNPYFKTK